MLRNKLRFVRVAILSVGLLGLAGSMLLVSARAPVNPKPAATPEIYALLLIGDRQAGPWPKGVPMTEGEDLAQFRRTQALLLRSRVVLQAGLEEKGISNLAILPKDQNAVTWLEETLVTEYLDNTGLLRVSFPKIVSDKGLNVPVEQAKQEQEKLLNTIVRKYVSRFGHDERESWKMRYVDLQQIIQQRQERLKSEHEHLRNMRFELGIVKPEKIAHLRETLQQQEKELRNLGKEIVGIEARIKFRKQSGQDTTPLREDLAVFQAQQPFLEEQVAITRKEINKGSQSSVELRMREEELAVGQRVLERLQEEREVLNSFLQSSRTSRIQIVAEADAGKSGK